MGKEFEFDWHTMTGKTVMLIKDFPDNPLEILEVGDEGIIVEVYNHLVAYVYFPNEGIRKVYHDQVKLVNEDEKMKEYKVKTKEVYEFTIKAKNREDLELMIKEKTKFGLIDKYWKKREIDILEEA